MNPNRYSMNTWPSNFIRADDIVSHQSEWQSQYLYQNLSRYAEQAQVPRELLEQYEMFFAKHAANSYTADQIESMRKSQREAFEALLAEREAKKPLNRIRMFFKHLFSRV